MALPSAATKFGYHPFYFVPASPLIRRAADPGTGRQREDPERPEHPGERKKELPQVRVQAGEISSHRPCHGGRRIAPCLGVRRCRHPPHGDGLPGGLRVRFREHAPRGAGDYRVMLAKRYRDIRILACADDDYQNPREPWRRRSRGASWSPGSHRNATARPTSTIRGTSPAQVSAP
uniref:Uncharacterized protein n=1 Tax=Candidatus Kentrum sp. SD TaxID=2126332 RepID=A0A451BPL5_9GAMM|nr:MAG: hypothetical protein BECKSD772D_GA0070982_109611 [Candidatus Kentron sp. SD]